MTEDTMVSLRYIETTGGHIELYRLRCGECGKLLAERITTPFQVRCSRCSATNISVGRVAVPAEGA